MLTITITTDEQYDEVNNEFVPSVTKVLQLEHSLISLSKWESRWCKVFLSKDAKKTFDESIDYIRCMTLTSNVSPDIYKFISAETLEQVRTYIEAPMTAMIFPKEKNVFSREIVTSDIIYYWMIALSIPFDCQKWHLNRLITLINVCNLKNQKPKKLSRKELASRNTALNAKRKQELNTKG